MKAALKIHSLKLIIFLLLSGADLFLTWQLLRQSGGQFYESNPVASAWLATYGWIGLIIFKVAMVAMIGLLAIYISLYRPRTSNFILVFACLVTGGVVLYSSVLKHRFICAADD